jgi:WhiB family redox-sensing transcriptional regulator
VSVSAADFEWLARAACASADLRLFFGEDFEAEAEAKAVCGTCSVRLRCLLWAMATSTEHGIYGGLNPEERARQRKNAQRAGARTRKAAA